MILNENTRISSSVIFVKVGQIYEHYKGKRYKIVNLARYSENPEEIFVIYEALYDCPSFGRNTIWARPLKMFTETIKINDEEKPRFKLIQEI